MSQLSAQQRLDRVRSADAQRWILAVVTIGASVIACLSASLAAPHHNPTGVIIAVSLLALAATLKPDSHVGLGLVTVIVVYWLAIVRDVTTPWSIAAATGLLIAHSTITLMAMCPANGVHDRVTMRRWVQRCGATTLGTVALWFLVVLFDHRRPAGNAVLTLTALVAIAAATLAVRHRSMPRP